LKSFKVKQWEQMSIAPMRCATYLSQRKESVMSVEKTGLAQPGEKLLKPALGSSTC